MQTNGCSVGQMADPRGDYNALPYPSMPFGYSQPSHLAALATLFGFETPAAETARVLELGCAAGGNIIPLAERFPDATFLGVDFGRRHVDDGRKRIAALNIKNVALREEDIMELSFAGAQFDYLICHGVFSWVANRTQDAIFRICRQALAPNGIAAISYNVLPGWHLRRVVRDICLYHVGTQGTPHERVAKARVVLQELAGLVSNSEPYGLLLRNEAKRFAQLPASYILGEFLASDNTPCYFHEFIDRAAQSGLAYLCEGDLGSSVSGMIFPETGARLRAISSPDLLALEQNKDFVTGRPFRRSLLTRTELDGGAPRTPKADRLRSLHIACQLTLDATRSDRHVSIYKDARGRSITARDPVVRRALARLAESYPSTLTLNQLAQSDARTDQIDEREVTFRICEALFLLVAADQAKISSLPLRAGRSSDDRPKAWSVARVEATAKQPWVTSLRHEALPLDTVARYLIGHLDGANDRQRLTALLADALRSGVVQIPDCKVDDFAGPDHDSVEAIAAQHVEQTLSFLARNALLAPAQS